MPFRDEQLFFFRRELRLPICTEECQMSGIQKHLYSLDSKIQAAKRGKTLFPPRVDPFLGFYPSIPRTYHYDLLSLLRRVVPLDSPGNWHSTWNQSVGKIKEVFQQPSFRADVKCLIEGTHASYNGGPYCISHSSQFNCSIDPLPRKKNTSPFHSASAHGEMRFFLPHLRVNKPKLPPITPLLPPSIGFQGTIHGAIVVVIHLVEQFFDLPNGPRSRCKMAPDMPKLV